MSTVRKLGEISPEWATVQRQVYEWFVSAKGKWVNGGAEIPSRIVPVAQEGIKDSMTPTLSINPLQPLGYNL